MAISKITGSGLGAITQDGAATFNEGSADVDFRVESNGNANMLFVDGGNDAVVIGHNDATNGTFASSQALQVVGTSFTTSSLGLTRFSADANGPSISLSKSRAAGIGTDTVVQDNDALGDILFTGADGTDMATQGASISAAIDGTPGGNDLPTRLTFATTGDGNSSPTERMRIASSGNVGIGTTSLGGGRRLTVAGGAIMVSGQNTSHSASSMVLGQDSTAISQIRFYGANTSTAGVLQFTGTSSDGSVGGERMRIDATGAVTMPAQPAFQVKPASAQENIAANNSAVTIVFGTEVFDQGADFASNTFTAPVTGKYQLNVNIYLLSLDSASQYYYVRITTSNRNYDSIITTNRFSGDPAYFTIASAVLADMDASDTAYVVITQESGTAQTDIGAAGTNFSGYLVA